MNRQIIIGFLSFTFFTFMAIALFSYNPNDGGVLSLSIHNMATSHPQNLSGKVGSSVASISVNYFGFTSWIIVFLGLVVSMYSLQNKISYYHIMSVILLVAILSAVVSTFISSLPLVASYSGGGIIGDSISEIMVVSVGQVGVAILSIVSLSTYLFYQPRRKTPS